MILGGSITNMLIFISDISTSDNLQPYKLSSCEPHIESRFQFEETLSEILGHASLHFDRHTALLWNQNPNLVRPLVVRGCLWRRRRNYLGKQKQAAFDSPQSGGWSRVLAQQYNHGSETARIQVKRQSKVLICLKKMVEDVLLVVRWLVPAGRAILLVRTLTLAACYRL